MAQASYLYYLLQDYDQALVAALPGDGEAARARVRAWEYQAR